MWFYKLDVETEKVTDVIADTIHGFDQKNLPEADKGAFFKKSMLIFKEETASENLSL